MILVELKQILKEFHPFELSLFRQFFALSGMEFVQFKFSMGLFKTKNNCSRRNENVNVGF